MAPLMEHQRSGIEFLRDRGRALLADDPGLGKTRQLIEASSGLTLVVAPAGVINGGTWHDELARWADDPDRFVVAPFTHLSQRRGSQVLDSIRPEYDRPWETLIVDEAHYIKGRKTNWTRRVQEMAGRVPQVYLATGTPISNWAHELFTSLQVLSPAERKGGARLGSYWRWVEDWFTVAPSRFSQHEIYGLRACRMVCESRPSWDPCEHYAEFMDANLGERFLRRRREDVLDLPPVTDQTVFTPMDGATKKMYRKMKKDYVAQLGDGIERTAWSDSERHYLLDQITTSPYLLIPEADRYKHKVCGGKLDQLAEDLANRPRPTLVVAQYKTTVDACANVALAMGLSTGVVHGGVSKDRAADVLRRFKRGELQVLCGSFETIAEGHTLTAADMCIFVEHSYKPYRNTQAMRRIHRMGQDRPVTVRRYVTPDSIDANRIELLETKNDHQMRMLSARDYAKLL